MPTVDPDRVTGWLALPAGTDATLVEHAAAAAGAFVEGLPWLDGVDPWPPDVDLAAVMLAARLYRRRNTPSGVEPFGDIAATYVARNDPDVARMLRIGPHAMPGIG